MSETEAAARFLPMKMPDEIRLVVDECVEQFRREGALLHYQRLNLFRGLVTFLHAYASPSMLERHILCISVHEAIQVFVNLEMEDDEIVLHVEPCRGTHTLNNFWHFCSETYGKSHQIYSDLFCKFCKTLYTEIAEQFDGK
jgi:hypothetical protein